MPEPINTQEPMRLLGRLTLSIHNCAEDHVFTADERHRIAEQMLRLKMNPALMEAARATARAFGIDMAELREHMQHIENPMSLAEAASVILRDPEETLIKPHGLNEKQFRAELRMPNMKASVYEAGRVLLHNFDEAAKADSSGYISRLERGDLEVLETSSLVMSERKAASLLLNSRVLREMGINPHDRYARIERYHLEDYINDGHGSAEVRRAVRFVLKNYEDFMNASDDYMASPYVIEVIDLQYLTEIHSSEQAAQIVFESGAWNRLDINHDTPHTTVDGGELAAAMVSDDPIYTEEVKEAIQWMIDHPYDFAYGGYQITTKDLMEKAYGLDQEKVAHLLNNVFELLEKRMPDGSMGILRPDLFDAFSMSHPAMTWETKAAAYWAADYFSAFARPNGIQTDPRSIQRMDLQEIANPMNQVQSARELETVFDEIAEPNGKIYQHNLINALDHYQGNTKRAIRWAADNFELLARPFGTQSTIDIRDILHIGYDMSHQMTAQTLTQNNVFYTICNPSEAIDEAGLHAAYNQTSNEAVKRAIRWALADFRDFAQMAGETTSIPFLKLANIAYPMNAQTAARVIYNDELFRRIDNPNGMHGQIDGYASQGDMITCMKDKGFTAEERSAMYWFSQDENYQIAQNPPGSWGHPVLIEMHDLLCMFDPIEENEAKKILRNKDTFRTIAALNADKPNVLTLEDLQKAIENPNFDVKTKQAIQYAINHYTDLAAESWRDKDKTTISRKDLGALL